MNRTILTLCGSLSLALASEAGAQNNAAPANVVTPAPVPREGTVGPEQLRDFALPGTRQPAPATEAPRSTPAPAPAPAPRATGATPAERPAPAATSRSEAAPERTPPPAREMTSPTPSPVSAETVAVPPPVEQGEPVTFDPPQQTAPAAPISVAPPASQASSLLPSWWPWLVVAMLGGIGLALVLRRRRQPALAGYSEDVFERVPPQPRAPVREPVPPAPPPPAPAPAAPPPAAPALPSGMVTTRLRSPVAPPPVRTAPLPVPPPMAGGVVSRRLRGWVTIELGVREILFSADEAVLRVDLLIANEGTGAAREIALEALAINAGDDQNEGIDNFFARPAASIVAIPELGALSDTVISHELRMPRSAIRAYEAQGRTLFVPVLLFNAAYRTAAGEGRTGAAFLVGRDNPGSDKLAPLVLPEGSGRVTSLAVRRLDQQVRR